MGAVIGTLCGVTARDPFDRLLDRCEWQGDCLVFTGGTLRGYGMFRPGTRSSDPKVYVHRWLYETTIGPLPAEHEIDHVRTRGCVSRACINPEHLEPVTHAENQERARLTTCRRGLHDLTDPANQRWDAQGNRRGCAPCHRDRARERSRKAA